MRDKSEFEPVCRTRLPTNWIFHPQFAFPLHHFIFSTHNKIISVLKIFIFLRCRIFVHFPCKNIYFATLISWRGPGVAKCKCWITRPPFCPPCGLSHHITCLPGNCIKYKYKRKYKSNTNKNANTNQIQIQRCITRQGLLLPVAHPFCCTVRSITSHASLIRKLHQKQLHMYMDILYKYKCFIIRQGLLIMTNVIYICTVLNTCLLSRVQWKKLFFSFSFWYTFFPVFFNSKTGLFSCIFWSEASFFCKFSCLCLHSGFTWQSPAKYIGWPKKYLSVRNMRI